MKGLGVVVFMAACSASTARQSLTTLPDAGEVDSSGVPDALIFDYGGPDVVTLDNARPDSFGADIVALDSTARTERPTVEVETTDGEAIDGGIYDSMPLDSQCSGVIPPCSCPHTVAVEGMCISCGKLPGDRCCADETCDNGATCVKGVCGAKS